MKKNAVIVLSIVLLFAVGGLVYVLNTSIAPSQLPRVAVEPSSITTPSSVVKDTTTEITKPELLSIDISPEAVGDWDTYRSKKYKFDIKYPNKFVVREYVYTQSPLGKSCDVVMWFNTEIPKTKTEMENMMSAGENKFFSFRIYTDPTEKCEQEQIIKRYTTSASSDPAVYLGKEEYVINEIKFMKKKYVAFPTGKSIDSDRIVYYVWELITGGKRYLVVRDLLLHVNLSNEQYGGNSSAENEFKKILSTFNVY